MAFIGDYYLDENTDLENPQVYAEVVEALKALPPPVFHEMPPQPNVSQLPSTEAEFHYQAAQEAYRGWGVREDIEDDDLLDETFKQLELAADANERAGNFRAQADNLMEYAIKCRDVSRNEEDISLGFPNAFKAVAIYQQQGRYDVLREQIPSLYEDMVSLINKKKNDILNGDISENTEEEIKNCREQLRFLGKVAFNGEHHLDDNIDLEDPQIYAEVVEALKALPPPQPSTEAEFHYQAAQEAYRGWGVREDIEDDDLLDETFEQLEFAADANERAGNFRAQADNLMEYAIKCRDVSRNEEDISLGFPNALKAVAIYQQQGRYDVLREQLPLLYEDIVNVINKKKNDILSGDISENTEEEIKNCREHLRFLGKVAFQVFDKDRGVPIDPTSDYVDENHVGFSDKARFGTSNIQTCGVLIMEDMFTNKFALGHVSNATYSMDSYFSRMSAPTEEVPFPAIIIGPGYLDGGENIPLSWQEDSKANLKKIINFIKSKPIHVKTAALSGYPKDIVIDPIKRCIYKAVPANQHPDAILTRGKLVTSSSLHIAFDRTISDEKAAHFLSAQSIALLPQSPDRPEETYAITKAENPNSTPITLPYLNELKLATKESHNQAVGELKEALDDKIKHLQNYLKGRDPEASINFSDVENAKQLIARLGVHIGEKKRGANQPLFDAIRALKLEGTGKVRRFNFESLIEIKFPDQPYVAVERQALLRRSKRAKGVGSRR